MKGFSLIEIILVVAILAILTSFSSIFYSRFLLQNSVDNTTDQIVSTLRKAQMYAMMSKRADTWSVNYSTNKITLFKGVSFSTRDASFDETFQVNPNIVISGLVDVSFARITGLPSPTSASITISSGNNTNQITLNGQGMVER